MTFKEFLSKQKAGSDERGDFLCLAKADTDFPDVGTWGEFYTYFAARYNNRLAYVGAPFGKFIKQPSEKRAVAEWHEPRCPYLCRLLSSHVIKCRKDKYLAI